MTISKDIKDREWGKFEDVLNKPAVRVSLVSNNEFTSYTVSYGECGRIESINYFHGETYLYTKVFSYDESGNLICSSKVVGD